MLRRRNWDILYRMGHEMFPFHMVLGLMPKLYGLLSSLIKEMVTLAELHSTYAETPTMKIFLHSQGKLVLCLSDLFSTCFS